MRAILDTNVLVSAVIIPGSISAQILEAWTRATFDSITSAPLMAELASVFRRPRILSRLGWSDGGVDAFLTAFGEGSELVEPEMQLQVVRDASDNRLLEAAVTGSADYIVSGDFDLRVLGQYEGVAIVTPAQFLALLRDDQDA